MRAPMFDSTDLVHAPLEERVDCLILGPAEDLNRHFFNGMVRAASEKIAVIGGAVPGEAPGCSVQLLPHGTAPVHRGGGRLFDARGHAAMKSFARQEIECALADAERAHRTIVKDTAWTDPYARVRLLAELSFVCEALERCRALCDRNERSHAGATGATADSYFVS